ncbi:MAG: hypothetical protein V9G12_17905 [Microthrixaceae bacterium]
MRRLRTASVGVEPTRRRATRDTTTDGSAAATPANTRAHAMLIAVSGRCRRRARPNTLRRNGPQDKRRATVVAARSCRGEALRNAVRSQLR